MTYPKLKPCPDCKTTDDLEIYTYESGSRRVECDRCFYLGPAGTSILWAIRLHNQRQSEATHDRA